jgi:predicted MFS family arabinose efflux permease
MTSETGELRRGWLIIVASLFGVMLGLASIPFYTIGIFAPLLSREFGWSFADVMFGITVLSASMIVAGPLAGRIADRYGARRLTIVSTVLFSLALGSFAFNQGNLMAYYASWCAISVLGIGTTAITYTRTLSVWFETRRGIAMGIALTGTGFFGLLGKPFTNYLIEAYSWRTAYLGLAALPLLISLPLAIAFLRDSPPRTVARAPSYGEAEPSGIAYLLSDWRFWLMAVVFSISSATAGSIVVNLENILHAHGFAKESVYRITPLVGLAVLTGRLATGMILDRVPTAIVAAGVLSCNLVAAAVLASSGISLAAATVGILAIGLSGGGGYGVLSFLTIRHFGIANYSTAYGALVALSTAGPGVGAVLLANSFDQTGTYEPVLWGAALVALISIPCMTLLHRVRAPNTPMADARL